MSRITTEYTASQQRTAVTEMAPAHPDNALRLAEQIADPWYRAQSLGWVARFATSESTAGRAFHGARKAAELGKDAYRRSAPLAWALRAALETGRVQLASAMLENALAEVPQIALFCSRADAFELLFPAIFPGGATFRDPVIALIRSTCPVDSHWRAGRLHASIAANLAWVGEDADAFVASLPAGRARVRLERFRARGLSYPPREFFWSATQA